MTSQVEKKLNEMLHRLSVSYPQGCVEFYTSTYPGTIEQANFSLEKSLEAELELHSLRTIIWFESLMLELFKKYENSHQLRFGGI